eukprot:scaffold1534_cov267-Pinguiococcus_pyrenoidosus.AAC.3
MPSPHMSRSPADQADKERSEQSCEIGRPALAGGRRNRFNQWGEVRYAARLFVPLPWGLDFGRWQCPRGEWRVEFGANSCCCYVVFLAQLHDCEGGSEQDSDVGW